VEAGASHARVCVTRRTPGAETDRRLDELSRVAERRGVRVRWLGAQPAPIVIADLEVDPLWPVAVAVEPGGPRALSPPGRSWNDASLVLRVRVADLRILFAADVGQAVERRLLEQPERLAAELLKLGHHGSRHSTSPAFLQAVSASRAVLSAPCLPSRGLPNAAVLERLRTGGVAISWSGATLRAVAYAVILARLRSISHRYCLS